jgi:hypothetical protein
MPRPRASLHLLDPIDRAEDMREVFAGYPELRVAAETRADEERVVRLLEVRQRDIVADAHAELHLDAADAEYPLDLVHAAVGLHLVRCHAGRVEAAKLGPLLVDRDAMTKPT